MNRCVKFFSCFNKMEIVPNWEEVNDKVPEFSLQGLVKKCKVVSVYDGDTIKVVFPIHDKLYKWNCRINGVDTPELRTRNEIEKRYGYKVRDKLREKILDKIVTVHCGDFDKYGRLLIDIYCDDDDDKSVSLWLIENKYAFEYHGGTKQKWITYLKENNLN